MHAPRALHSTGVARALLLVVVLSACGDDDSTGPSANFDLVGQWDWRITNAAGQNATCTVTNVTLTFTRDNGVLAGRRFSTGGGNIVCTFNGSPVNPASMTGDQPIQSLVLNGTAISFQFANLSPGPWEIAGNVTGDTTMGGTATMRMATSVGVLTLTGPWVATRR